MVREAVNVTENRSAQRCLREIGVREEDLHKVLSVCVDILRLLIDNDPGVEIELDPDINNQGPDFPPSTNTTKNYKYIK